MILPISHLTDTYRDPVLAIAAVLAVLVLGGCSGETGGPGEASPGERTDSSPGSLERARELVASGRARESISILKKLGPEAGPRAQEILARAYHRTERWNQSIESADKALLERPKDPDLLYLKADGLRSIEEPQAARKILEEILERAPNHWEAKLSLGRILQRMTSSAEALPLFEAYLRDAPADHHLAETARLEYGRALRSLRRHQDAADQFAGLLEEEPSNNIYYSELSSTLYRMRLRPQARLLEEIYRVFSEQAFEEHVEKGLFASGRDGIAMGQRAWNMRNQKRFLESFNAYEEALALNPTDPRIKIYYADLCLKFERHGQAFQLIDRELQNPPGPAPRSGLLAARGKILLFAERNQEVAQTLKKATEVLRREGNLGGYARGQADGLSLYNNLAEALINLGDNTEAGKLLAAIRKSATGNPRYLYLAGKLSLKSGRNAPALGYLEQAIRLQKESTAPLEAWKAAALARSGKIDAALSLLLQLPATAGGPEVFDLVRAALPPEHPERVNLEKMKSRSKLADKRLSDLQGRLQTLELGDAACARIFTELGSIYEGQGNPAALDYYFLASDIDPSNPDVLRKLLKQLEERRYYFTRMRLLRRLSEAAPGDFQALASLCRLYLDLHIRLNEARDMALRCLAARPDPDSYLLASRASLLRGDREEARRLIEKGLRLAPGDARLEKALATLDEK